jgi:hypothetical protein
MIPLRQRLKDMQNHLSLRSQPKATLVQKGFEGRWSIGGHVIP